MNNIEEQIELMKKAIELQEVNAGVARIWTGIDDDMVARHSKKTDRAYNHILQLLADTVPVKEVNY